MLASRNIMINPSDVDFENMYKALPSDLKEILNSSEVNDTIISVCEGYGFAEKFSEVQKNVGLVLAGALSIEDFKNYIQMLSEQGGAAAYNKIYVVAFAPVERYLILENGQTFFGSVPAPLPKNTPNEPLKTSTAPPRPDMGASGADPYREKPE